MLQQSQAFLIDMDGVLWRGEQSLPGIKPFFALLRARQLPFLLVTNNSSKTPEQYQQKLQNFGIEVAKEQILTSALVAAQCLRQEYPGQQAVYWIGMQGLQQALEQHGFYFSQQAELVVVGSDWQLSYDKLKTACVLISQGAHFYGTNADVSFPAADGIYPGNGATLAALEAATGRQAKTFGKPEAPLFVLASKILGSDIKRITMIGDRYETDILGAKRQGFQTVLLLSGITSATEVAHFPEPPDYVFGDLSELCQAWCDSVFE